MTKKIKQILSDLLSDHVLEYFANIISSYEINKQIIKLAGQITKPQEKEICEILFEHNREYINVPCDPEGPTPQQDKQLDKILEKCCNEIAHVILNSDKQ